MNVEADVSPDIPWWRLDRAHALESHTFRRAVWLGISFLTVTAAAALVVAHLTIDVSKGGITYAANVDLDDARNKWATGELCTSQSEWFERRRSEARKLCETALSRKQRFEQALNDPSDAYFGIARQAVEEERRAVAAAEEAYKRTAVETAWGQFPWPTILGVMVVIVGVLGTRVLLLHAKQAGLPVDKMFVGWLRPYVLLTAISYAWLAAIGIWTSVFDTQKTWWAWDSYCVSPMAFMLNRISLLGLTMLFVCPIATLWTLGRKDMMPAIDPERSCRGWGVESYVLFAQTWTLLILILAIVTSLTWTKYVGAHLTPVYLLPAVGWVMLAMILAAQLIWNGVCLRLQYQEAVAKLPATTQSPDPTIPFLGQHWWQLPTLIIGVAGSYWAVLEWCGVGKMIEGALK